MWNYLAFTLATLANSIIICLFATVYYGLPSLLKTLLMQIICVYYYYTCDSKKPMRTSLISDSTKAMPTLFNQRWYHISWSSNPLHAVYLIFTLI